jgi:hypothetical protein
MGLPVYTAQVIRAAFQGTVGDRNWANIVHYKYEAGPPSPEDLTTMAEALDAQWITSLTPYQDPDTSMNSVKLTDLTSALASQVELGTPTPGTREGDLLPASACLLVTYDIDYRYRGGHPRNYLSVGVQGDLLNAQNWTSDFADAAKGAWNEVTELPIGETYGTTTVTSLGFVQLRLHGDVFSEGVYYPFSSPDGLAQTEIGTIKRRIRKGSRRR